MVVGVKAVDGMLSLKKKNNDGMLSLKKS